MVTCCSTSFRSSIPSIPFVYLVCVVCAGPLPVTRREGGAPAVPVREGAHHRQTQGGREPAGQGVHTGASSGSIPGYNTMIRTTFEMYDVHASCSGA